MKLIMKSLKFIKIFHVEVYDEMLVKMKSETTRILMSIIRNR